MKPSQTSSSTRLRPTASSSEAFSINTSGTQERVSPIRQTAVNKFAGFFQRVWKRKGKDFSFGQDPRAATQRDPHTAHYGVGHIKWTMTATSKLLL